MWCTHVVLFTLLLLQLSSGLYIYTSPSSSPLYLTSRYSSLGTFPTLNTQHSILVIKPESIRGCDLNASITLPAGQSLNNTIIVFPSMPLPTFRPCNTDPHSSTTTLARLAQELGVSGIILKQPDEFRGGRSVGFADDISIRVLVAPGSTIAYLTYNVSSIQTIELSPISSGELSVINEMKREYLAWYIVTIFIYCALIVMFGYLLIVDLKILRRSKHKFSNGAFMKVFAIFAALVSLLWVAIDPFGFKGYTRWPSSAIEAIAKGAIFSVYLLILRVWIKVVGVMNKSHMMKVVFTRLCYVAVVILIVVSALCGTIWYNETTDFIYMIFSSGVVMALGFGYGIVGRSILMTLTKSGNKKSNKEVLVYKIAGFIVYYGLVALVGLSVVYLHVRNHIYTVMICSIAHGFCVMVTFVLLFFRSKQQMKNTSPHKPPGLASKHSPIPLTPPVHSPYPTPFSSCSSISLPGINTSAMQNNPEPEPEAINIQVAEENSEPCNSPSPTRSPSFSNAWPSLSPARSLPLSMPAYNNEADQIT